MEAVGTLAVAIALVAVVANTGYSVVAIALVAVVAIAEVDTEAAGVDRLVVVSTAGDCYSVDTA